jgi:hypothetical protein
MMFGLLRTLMFSHFNISVSDGVIHSLLVLCLNCFVVGPSPGAGLVHMMHAVLDRWCERCKKVSLFVAALFCWQIHYYHSH